MHTVVIKRTRHPDGWEYVTAFDANTGQEIPNVSAIDIRVRPDSLTVATIQVSVDVEPIQAQTEGYLVCEHGGKRYRMVPIDGPR